MCKIYLSLSVLWELWINCIKFFPYIGQFHAFAQFENIYTSYKQLIQWVVRQPSDFVCEGRMDGCITCVHSHVASWVS